MTKRQFALVAWLVSPLVVVSALCWAIAGSIASRERQALRYPAVGAGAGDTGGANALGELLAGNSASHGRTGGAERPVGSRREIDLGGEVGPVHVWLPAGYDDAASADRAYPVLVLLAGEDAVGAGAGSWRGDDAADALAARGVITPIIVVGASWREVAVMPDAGEAGRAARFAEDLARRLRGALRVTPGASLVIGGGGPAAGAALAMAAGRPQDFGGVLLESLPLGDERSEAWEAWLDGVAGWPAKVWLGVGDHELGREPGRAGANAARRAAVHRIGARLIRAGRTPETFAVVTGPGETADASSWSRRLPDALGFFFASEREGDAPPSPK